MKKIRITSFNTQHCLNYITRKIDFDLFVSTIKELGSDIVGLNEMRDKGEADDYQEQAKILADKLGFYYYFAKAIDFDGVNPYGNAIISRYPIKSAKTVLIPDPLVKNEGGYYETRCLLIANVDVDGTIIKVLVTHFGLNKSEQVNAVNTIMENIDGAKVLMGDFNVLPENEVLTPIRKAMTDTAKSNSDPMLSFPSDNPNRKIDYVFVANDVKVISASVPPIVASDHRPYVADIEI